MKKCSYCAEEIQEKAIKCKHCGEFLNKKPKVKWYFRNYVFIIALLCVGPLALPLYWFNPVHSNRKKIIVTIIVLILSFFLAHFTVNAIKTLREYYRMLFSIMSE